MPKVAIVTGANQGLGLALARGLCRTLAGQGVVYLTARDRGRGQQAVAGLQAEGAVTAARGPRRPLGRISAGAGAGDR